MGNMQESLYKAEAASVARSSGNLIYDSWSYDVILALGLSSVTNPIGYYLVRLLSESKPSPGVVNKLYELLCAYFIRYGNTFKSDCIKAAIAYVIDPRCPVCEGRGVIDFEQNVCKECNGSGKIDISGLPEKVTYGITVLLSYLDKMDGQLSYRMKDTTPYLELAPVRFPGSTIPECGSTARRIVPNEF